jgi:hypothetical protein
LGGSDKQRQQQQQQQAQQQAQQQVNWPAHTPNPRPQTLNPNPSLNPCALNHSSLILNRKLYTLNHPEPRTLNTKPTNPDPQTLSPNPKPQTPDPRLEP